MTTSALAGSAMLAEGGFMEEHTQPRAGRWSQANVAYHLLCHVLVAYRVRSQNTVCCDQMPGR